MSNLTARQEKDLVDNFLHKIGARARISSARRAVYDPPRFNDFIHNYQQTIHYREEAIVEMEVPETAFKKMIEDSHDIEELRAKFGPNIDNMGLTIMHRDFELRNEAAIRRTNPGVQKAWERYQTMLKLAGG